MTEELANIVTQRVQTQLGAMLMQIIQLQAEKEAAQAPEPPSEPAPIGAKAP